MRDYIVKLVERHIGKGQKRGSEISLKCPFHKGGNETRPSFSVNVEKGLYHCFTCDVAGSMPQLLRLLGLPPSVIDQELEPIRQALLVNKRIRHLERAYKLGADRFVVEPILNESVLVPYNHCPLSLVESGFSEEWLKYKEIGFDPRLFRVTFPIRDMYGNLAGVSGRSEAEDAQPRYKLYSGGYTDKKGKKVVGDFGESFDEMFPNYRLKNHELLWNFELVYPRLFGEVDGTPLIVVEGFKACLWLLQNGFWNTVALMGSSLGWKQKEHILRLNSNVILMLDNDEAGQRGSRKAKSSLMRAGRMAHIAAYESEDLKQPDQLTQQQISEMLVTSIEKGI